MAAQTAPTLPECLECGAPMRRATWDARAGMCTPCGVNAVAPPTDPARLALADWQRTVADVRHAERRQEQQRAARRAARRDRRTTREAR